MFLQSAKSRTSFYLEYIGYVPLLNPYQRPECCFKAKISSCLDRDMTIFRDFEGPRPRQDVGIARPRHSKTCLETCLLALASPTGSCMTQKLSRICQVRRLCVNCFSRKIRRIAQFRNCTEEQQSFDYIRAANSIILPNSNLKRYIF